MNAAIIQNILAQRQKDCDRILEYVIYQIIKKPGVVVSIDDYNVEMKIDGLRVSCWIANAVSGFDLKVQYQLIGQPSKKMILKFVKTVQLCSGMKIGEENYQSFGVQ